MSGSSRFSRVLTLDQDDAYITPGRKRKVEVEGHVGTERHGGLSFATPDKPVDSWRPDAGFISRRDAKCHATI